MIIRTTVPQPAENHPPTRSPAGKPTSAAAAISLPSRRNECLGGGRMTEFDRCLRDIRADFERPLDLLDADLAAHGITSH